MTETDPLSSSAAFVEKEPTPALPPRADIVDGDDAIGDDERESLITELPPLPPSRDSVQLVDAAEQQQAVCKVRCQRLRKHYTLSECSCCEHTIR